MSERDGDLLKGGIKGDGGRAQRLAAELRRNLNRRKQRARAMASQKGHPSDDSQEPDNAVVRKA